MSFGRFAHLIPDHDDNREDIVSSFGDLRRNTLQTLYNVGSSMMDKSPKGSVDEAIQPLVDLINFHPSYTTLSSCSGRISLFDPYLSEQTKEQSASSDSTIDENGEGASGDTMIPSGKGYGGWLLVSHDQLSDPSSLSKLLDETETDTETSEMNDRMIAFKMEPLLLHVAAATLQRGRQLLNLALSLGFRESGLIVSTSKITVAIRGHSLALCVPLARSGPLRPSNEYLNSLIEEANYRLSINEEKLQRLTNEVKKSLFRERPVQKPNQYSATFHSLPRLNLWGHAAVTVQTSKSDDVDVLIFGGYGRGPDVLSYSDSDVGQKSTPENRASCRSDRIYSLSKKGGVWNKCWTEVTAMPLTGDESKRADKSWYGLEIVSQSLTAREGIDACILPLPDPMKPVIALWGGRTGPLKPKDDLLLYEPITRPGIFVAPSDIRGESPSPRWGHTLTALKGTEGHLALLMGGRDDKKSLSSVHMLSIIQNSASDSYMLWQTIEINSPPQFHHTALTTPDDDDILIIFGGISNPNNMIEAFSDPHNLLDASCEATDELGDTHGVEPFSVFHIDVETCIATKYETLVHGCQVDEINPFAFGASSCGTDISSGDSTNNLQQLLLFCGGIPQIDSSTCSIPSGDENPFRCFTTIMERPKDLFKLVPYQINMSENSNVIDFGSMVHHRALSVPRSHREERSDCGEVLLIGGGVSSFAFGASFSESYRVEFSLEKKSDYVGNLLEPKVDSRDSQRPVVPKSSIRGTNAKAQETNVIYVIKKNAKALKTALEADGYLDKTFRMTSAPAELKDWDPKLHIAVPVTKSCLQAMEGKGIGGATSWKSLVLGTGIQEVPFSTAVLGLKKR